MEPLAEEAPLVLCHRDAARNAVVLAPPKVREVLDSALGELDQVLGQVLRGIKVLHVDIGMWRGDASVVPAPDDGHDALARPVEEGF